MAGDNVMALRMGARCLSMTWLGLAAFVPYANAQVVDPLPTVEPLGNLQPPGPDPQKLAVLVKNQKALVSWASLCSGTPRSAVTVRLARAAISTPELTPELSTNSIRGCGPFPATSASAACSPSRRCPEAVCCREPARRRH